MTPRRPSLSLANAIKRKVDAELELDRVVLWQRFGRHEPRADALGRIKEDHRPPRGAWADGGYLCKCMRCGEHFVGDKRALVCADCAYKEQQT